MYRRVLYPRSQEWVRKAPVGDWPIFLLLAQQGELRRMDGIWGAYRIHPGGSYSSGSKIRIFNSHLVCYEHYKSHFTSPQHRALIKSALCRLSFDLAHLCLQANDISSARRYLLKCARNYTRSAAIPVGNYITFSLQVFTPPVYAAWKMARWYLGYLNHPRRFLKTVRAIFHIG